MWNRQQTQPQAPAAPPPLPQASPMASAAASPASVIAFGAPSAPKLATSTPRSLARLGSGLHIKGQLTGTEDLQIDGKVEGPISLNGHQLIVGATAVLNSEIHAGEVIVYGKVIGNLHGDRVDVKTDGSVTGDISTARISIEDGAHFKGRIEIDPAKSHAAAD